MIRIKILTIFYPDLIPCPVLHKRSPLLIIAGVLIFLFCVIHMQNGKDDLIVFQPVLVKFSVYDILLKLCQRVFIIPIQD